MPYSLIALRDFIVESNLIEGIELDNETLDQHVVHYDNFLANFGRENREDLDLEDVFDIQELIAPGYPLRDQEGMDVIIGKHICPRGGPGIIGGLKNVILEVNYKMSPWGMHKSFENLHPFMDGNGRTGRAIWAWQMVREGYNFHRKFLQEFYYQTLARGQ